ncbi:MAG: XdhC family protein [Actinomycetota bacterium]|nr:XdhC family protein [Actinomycetota bacterium]
MGETAQVLSAISALRAQGQRMALATIVGVKGSTYRRAGARLLVPDAGELVGNLSGGCLEGEVEGLARSVMAEDRPRLALFDLTADDEVIWGWGLGCNGAIEVFIEPADRAAETADALRLALEQERPIAVATVISSDLEKVPIGARMLVRPGETPEGGTGAEAVDGTLAGLASGALVTGVTETRTVAFPEGDVRVFLEALQPPIRLLVCGAGHDAIPLVAAAAAMGWRVVVADDRDAFLDARRFPGATRFLSAEPAAAAEALELDGRTYAVVMSHNYLRDRDYLRGLLDTEVAYIGMLGPNERLRRLLDDLSRQEVSPSGIDTAKLHGPAGLDVGAEGPEEIASAIVAEILAVSRGRRGGFLRDRPGPIHDRAQAAGHAAAAG